MSDRAPSGPLGENSLLAHIATRSAELPRVFPRVEIGPGDDCAVFATRPRSLLKVDQIVEGRHFTRGAPIDLIARKAIARPVSDLAAMAGTPVAALAAAVLPSDFTRADELFDACARWAASFGCPIIGGDISMTAASEGGGRLTLSITILGDPHLARGPVLRSGARPGDHVYVTGVLGGSFIAETGLGKHLTFEPRLAEARWLADTLGVRLHAMMDLSDGLGLDGARLARASGVRLRLNAAHIPMSPSVAIWRQALSDGEDYELLFASAPDAPLPPIIPGTTTTLTRIGEVADGSGCVILDAGREVDVSTLGFEHHSEHSSAKRAKDPA